MKIRPVGAEVFYVDRRTDGRDEFNSLFFNFAKGPKNYLLETNCSVRSLDGYLTQLESM